ncbi:hypothetical protein VitviT2T_009707 [Vitis vinifera]|uniref:Meiosis-specific protein ASY3-like coiled-coil domain-containing protein n=1 Tax=Vitis vinifera TaxID=29760 RepID=A0ABY9C5L3_VITVI|nr:meiosis-specific protein ASY3 [Vitis vinifera]XP_010652332.1 meiosis-specific protein ASY3 [Vitis vinifera]WJZ90573.1 hypothetical protein VitviT2T_009707 [Vitis vinifera]|eukprot:XP_010652331.1 PREDICTED: uncharacterized protein LOC104879806 [Vitis vinifera]
METMEIEGQVIQDDQMSNCRSFGSNYHPSSQSRKISIGVMIDSLAKIGSEGMKDDEVAVLNAEKATSNRGRKNKEQGLAAAIISKQNEAPVQESSPWINTKSFYKKRPIIETVYTKQTSSLNIARGRENKVNGAKETLTTSSIQFFANQNSMLQSGNGNQKKFNRVTDKSSGGKDGTTEMEEFRSSDGQGVGVSDKVGTVVKINKTEKRTSEALKMKLWEVLGNASSPNKQFFSGSKTLEMDANSPMVEPNFDQKGNTIVKPRQNSDSIEPDSESPDATTRRPVTRSLTRKRAPTKVQAKKVKSGPSSSCKQKLKERSIFSFKVGLSGELHDAVNGVLQKSIKKGERKSCRIEPRKIWFPEKDNADRIKPANDGSKALPPSEKASLLGNRMENFQGCPLNNGDGDHVEPKKGDQEKDFHGSPVTKKADKVGDVDSPALTKSADGQEDLSNPSLNILEDPQDFHSLTFRMRTPMRNSSPYSPPRTDGMEQDVCSPAVAEKIFTFGAIHCFRTLPTPKRDCYGSKMQSESDDAEELRVSPTKKSVPIVKEKDEGNESSKSSSEERDSDCFKEISPIDQGYHSSQETDIFSPEIVPADTPKFTLRPAKRLRSHGGIKFNEFSPDPLFPKGTEGSTEFQCFSEQNQEDGLSRAISLFSLALERMKSKMETETSKRSSEIVMSVAEGIHLQLQNVQSQMQKDVGKLTSLSKLKRKRLETRFQEQQEQLKLIHEKFKDEINQHIQDCRSSIEGLEVHQIELKRNVERQKASHQKLLLQVEEAIEIQLNDAQQRITAIHKMARQKMLQLKLVLGECLKDGILS